MKFIKQRLITGILAVLIVLSLGTFISSCKTNDTNKDTKSLAGTVVRKYIWYNKIPDSEKAADQYFEQQTGAKVERVMVPWESIDMKFTLDISAGNPVDVVYMNDQKFPTYPIKGIVQPIDNLLPKDDPLWKSNALNIFAFGGKHYGIATGITPLLLWYNKTMFEENDIKTPNEYYNEGKWNWDTFAEVAKKLTVRGSDGTVQKWGYSSWRFDALMLSNAGRFVQFMPNGSIKLSLNEPNSVKALQFMQDAAFKDKWMDPTGNYTWGQDFNNGNVAMTCEAAFLAWNGNFDGIKFKVDFAPLPIGPDNKNNIYPGRADAAGVCAGAKNPKGAIEYIRKTIEYGKKNEDKSDAKKALTAEQFALNKKLSEETLNVAMFMGIGDLQAKQFGLWDAILSKGKPVASAIATETPGWQNEINICLKNNKLPVVKPFTAPPTIDFESGPSDYIIVKSGNDTGVKAFEVTADAALVVKGKSLLITADPNSETGSVLFTSNPAKVSLPAYHTYKVTFDYKIIDSFGEGGVMALCLRPTSDPINGANIGWVEITDLTAGKTGTVTGEFTPVNQVDDLAVVCIGQLASKVVIDNIKIIDSLD
jgi:multiple sugar transport system substrate-binding protein